MASTTNFALSSIIKSQFGLDEGDDFDSEPTSVLDLTQCISPPLPLQPDAWVEQQQQAAIGELNVWQQQQQQQLLQQQQQQLQQNLLWGYQLSEEQQLWEEQQLQNLWEQNEFEMQYMYESDQIMDNYSCDEFSTSYQSLDDHHQQQPNNNNNSTINNLRSYDDYKEAQLLNSLTPLSGNFPGTLPSPTNADSNSSAHLMLDDWPLFSEDEIDDDDQNDAIFSQLRDHFEVTNSEPEFLPPRLNNNNNHYDNSSLVICSQPAEDPLYRILHQEQQQLQQPASVVPQRPTHHDHHVAAARGAPHNSSWYEMDVTPAAEKPVNVPSHPPTPDVGTRKIEISLGGQTARGHVQLESKKNSGDAEEDSMSIVSTVTSTSSKGRPPAPSTVSTRSSAVSGSGRVVTLAELASGGVKMGGVQLPNVGTQIPSVIRLAVETQTSSGMGGVRMVQLLLACAEAVACRDSRQANILLQQLQHMATPTGDAMQRITACFVEGLTDRLAITGSQPFKFSSKPPGPRKPPSEMEKLDAFQLVYRVSPFLAFGHLAANAAILEAFEKEDKLHIVDLGMSHALQWPYLIHDLAARAGGPPSSLRITGFGPHATQLKEVGEELVRIAKARNIPFEFRAVNEPLENMRRSMLELREGEALAVNSVLQLHCVVKESRGSLNAVLQTIHELSPKILTLVEQDASHNGPFFLGRFMEALHYYSAIFDSLDVILPRKCPYRLKMEQFHFAEEIKNIVSCEGPARVERHERVDQWRRKMSRAGFQPLPLKFLSQARMWLNHYKCDGYTLSEEKGCLVMGWKGKPIIAASSWKR